MIELDKDIRTIVGGYLEDAMWRFIKDDDLWIDLSHVKGLSEDEPYGSVEDEYVSWSYCRDMGESFILGWSGYGCAFDGQYSCSGGVHVRDREIVIVALVMDRARR